MTGIAERLAAVRDRIDRACVALSRDPSTVGVLAVSKTHSANAVRAALAAGICEFGENRVKELVEKADALVGAGARWHMIGSVQTNKVDVLIDVPGLALVHSIDRLRLVDRLATACASRSCNLDVLVQVNATQDDQKHGVALAGLSELARHVVESRVLRLLGVMAMGPLRGEPLPVFGAVAAALARLRDELGMPLPVLSLGMSGDLESAIAAGSTLVRIGTAIFGERD